MKFFILFFVAVAQSAESSNGKCCEEKTVGDILYKLVESDKDEETSKFGCKDGCVYNADEDPVDRFCFAPGDLKVTCLEKFHWCYEGDCGPDKWGTAFPACNGKSQSPIDIVPADTATAEPSAISFGNYDKIRIEDLSVSEEHYPGAPKEKGDRLENGLVKNNGHTAQLDVISTLPGDVGILKGGPLPAGSEYQILQFHFHWGADDTKGSEHTLNGKMFPLEVHIVHKKVGEPNFLSVPGGLAVTGFFFEIDANDNAALTPLVEKLGEIKEADKKYNMSGSPFLITDMISGVAPLKQGDTYKYTSYSGSLTTPGCMEIVNWINFLEPLKISSKQLAEFRNLQDKNSKDIVDNFRPPQPLNGRVVTTYGRDL